MEALFGPVQDVRDDAALDVVGSVEPESAVDARRSEGDFAAGLRRLPFVCRPGDFAAGLRVASVRQQTCDFATGLRTYERAESTRGDFATGQRRAGADPG